MLDSNIIVNNFKLQLCYYIHFRTNIPGKGDNLLTSLAMSEIAVLLFFFKNGFSIK